MAGIPIMSVRHYLRIVFGCQDQLERIGSQRL